MPRKRLPNNHPIYNQQHGAYRIWGRMWRQSPYPIHSDWDEFENFAKWCDTQIGYQHGFDFCSHLKPNVPACNSPATSAFLPRDLAALLVTGFDEKAKSNTGTQGVHERVDGRFTAHLFGRTKARICREFDTIEEAHEAYRFTKVKRIQFLAEEWKWKLDHRVYEALSTYELE